MPFFLFPQEVVVALIANKNASMLRILMVFLIAFIIILIDMVGLHQR